MEALGLANHRKREAAKQRKALVGKPVREVVAALVNPTEELAALRLRVLLTPGKTHAGPIPKLGEIGIGRALEKLGLRSNGEPWHDHLRLRDLSEDERRQLVRALIDQGSQPWRRAA
jgi:hypothetical protein